MNSYTAFFDRRSGGYATSSNSTLGCKTAFSFFPGSEIDACRKTHSNQFQKMLSAPIPRCCCGGSSFLPCPWTDQVGLQYLYNLHPDLGVQLFVFLIMVIFKHLLLLSRGKKKNLRIFENIFFPMPLYACPSETGTSVTTVPIYQKAL